MGFMDIQHNKYTDLKTKPRTDKVKVFKATSSEKFPMEKFLSNREKPGSFQRALDGTKAFCLIFKQ